jgi:hypothetical protein
MAGARRRSGRHAVALAAFAAAFGVGVAALILWLAPVSREAPPDPMPEAAASPEALLARAPSGAGPATAQTNGTTPEGMTAEQWQMLQISLKDDPRRDTEIKRITDYMSYLSRLARFRALRADSAVDQAQARTLARGLLDALPRHVAQGEINAGEAQVMQQVFLDTLYADDPARATQGSLQRQRLAEVLPASAEASAAAARDAQYQRAQAAVVAQWYAKPESERNPRELESSLDALRRSSYPPAAAGSQE